MFTVLKAALQRAQKFDPLLAPQTFKPVNLSQWYKAASERKLPPRQKRLSLNQIAINSNCGARAHHVKCRPRLCRDPARANENETRNSTIVSRLPDRKLFAPPLGPLCNFVRV